MKAYILFHAGCADGFAAAWVVRRFLGPGRVDVRYLPVQYTEPVPNLEDGSEVYLLDFSYGREPLCLLRARMHTLTVIDHHETAAEALAVLGERGVYDVRHSGAWLTWSYFFPGEPVPALVTYVQDRDLWQWRLPDSREVSAWLRSLPWDFATWDRAAAQLDADRAAIVPEGAAILRVERRHMERIVATAQVVHWSRGQRIEPAVIVNAPVLQSEVAERLQATHPDARLIALYYDDRSSGQRVWGLRSQQVHVGYLAQLFGGGGHARAAGFHEPLEPSTRFRSQGGAVGEETVILRCPGCARRVVLPAGVAERACTACGARVVETVGRVE